jgi:hypothetical protein
MDKQKHHHQNTDGMSVKPLTTRGYSPDKPKYSTLLLPSRNPILGTDSRVLPEYSQRAKQRLRSSVNYDDLGAGKT